MSEFIVSRVFLYSKTSEIIYNIYTYTEKKNGHRYIDIIIIIWPIIYVCMYNIIIPKWRIIYIYVYNFAFIWLTNQAIKSQAVTHDIPTYNIAHIKILWNSYIFYLYSYNSPETHGTRSINGLFSCRYIYNIYLFIIMYIYALL